MNNGYSIIDIGSNSVRYMDGAGEKQLITTRLASGLNETGRLSDASMARSLDVIGSFVRLSREQGLEPRAYATSAVRDAGNSSIFVESIMREYGIQVDVLSGEREADYALLGACAQDGGLVDIGGGSSQLIFSGFRESVPMGCVRAKDLLKVAATLDGMRSTLNDACSVLFRFPRIYLYNWVGVGGTITTLAALSLGLSAYDKAKVSACVLTLHQVEEMVQALHDQGDAARSTHPLLIDRHDVIVPGALILLFIMRGMGISTLRVSDADGMEGYMKHLQAKQNETAATSF